MRTSIAIVGSGFSGIGLAIRLKQAGLSDFTIFEKAGDLGGVWRDNTYPGAACDAPSHLYSYSFEPNPDWSRRFAGQPEILAYLRRCAIKYSVAGHIRYHTEITSAEFGTGHWVLRAADGATCTAGLLVAACGQLSRPARPDIPGLDDVFTGRVFHSANWDHDHDLRGRRVAVIGNGASAIQFVPHVAAQARQLIIFQRQPHWVSPKPDRVYPAFRKALNRRLLRAALLPEYEVGCNRILTSNDYYPALNRPSTQLVTSPISVITADAVITADGHEYPADTIILATGFRTHDFVAPMRVTGPSGQDLDTVWQRRPRAYLGMAVPGFPNFFLMYGPNTNVGSGSIVHMLESQMAHITTAATLIAGGGRLELRSGALQESDSATQHRLAGTVWNAGGCHSWYLTDGVNTSNWPGSMSGYRRRARHVNLSHYRLSPPATDTGWDRHP